MPINSKADHDGNGNDSDDADESADYSVTASDSEHPLLRRGLRRNRASPRVERGSTPTKWFAATLAVVLFVGLVVLSVIGLLRPDLLGGGKSSNTSSYIISTGAFRRGVITLDVDEVKPTTVSNFNCSVFNATFNETFNETFNDTLRNCSSTATTRGGCPNFLCLIVIPASFMLGFFLGIPICKCCVYCCLCYVPSSVGGSRKATKATSYRDETHLLAKNDSLVGMWRRGCGKKGEFCRGLFIYGTIWGLLFGGAAWPLCALFCGKGIVQVFLLT